MILDNLFQNKTNPHVKKHKLLVRKILSRLIRRCGIVYLTKIMPEYHKSLLIYLEKEKRKSDNKRSKTKLMMLVGD